MTRFAAAPPALRPPAPPPGDEACRVRLGASTDAAPEHLAVLAADPAVTVRAAVALNPTAPAEADRILARDNDQRVRTLLARKLATLVPSLHIAERDRLQRHVLAVLAVLVEDEAVRVRATIADVVKEMPEAPHDLILRLAHDSAVPVSEPVIRLSPLLTTEDLLSLLATSPQRATAVASRAGLNETVSDALAALGDPTAIGALLANHSAAIREATLDALAARAAGQPAWHAPLARHPRLSPAAARALSEYVTTHLLDEMASRADLPRELTGDLKRRLAARRERDTPPHPAASPGLDEAMQQARTLAAGNRLTEATLLGAVERGEARLATALLAVAAEMPAAVVERATTLRSAKALVSLVWRAGFSMQVAGPLQTLLARTPPGLVLRPGPGGAFPLAIDEMRWQIDFLTRLGR